MLHDLSLTPEALRAVAEWAHVGDDAAPVLLLVDDSMLIAEQGDERAAWDFDGSPGSEEYLALAPLDRPPAMYRWTVEQDDEHACDVYVRNEHDAERLFSTVVDRAGLRAWSDR
jgi:hypothetical protein